MPLLPKLLKVFTVSGTPEEMEKKIMEELKNLPPPKAPTYEELVDEFEGFINNGMSRFTAAMLSHGASHFDVLRALHVTLAHNAGLVEELRRQGEEKFVQDSVDEDVKRQRELGRKHFIHHSENDGNCPDDPYELKNDAKAKA